MDPGQIGNAILGLAVAAGTLTTWMSTSQRKTRARNRRFTQDLMAYEEWVSMSIASRHRHNIRAHAGDPESFIEIPPLPEPMIRADEEV